MLRIGHLELSKCYPSSTWETPSSHRPAILELCGRAIICRAFPVLAYRSDIRRSGGIVIALTGSADETNRVGFPKTWSGRGLRVPYRPGRPAKSWARP